MPPPHISHGTAPAPDCPDPSPLLWMGPSGTGYRGSPGGCAAGGERFHPAYGKPRSGRAPGETQRGRPDRERRAAPLGVIFFPSGHYDTPPAPSSTNGHNGRGRRAQTTTGGREPPSPSLPSPHSRLLFRGGPSFPPMRNAAAAAT